MRKILFLLFIILIFLISPTFSKEKNIINVVYPLSNAVINAPSTFIVGSASPKSKLTINEKKVKVYPKGSFVQVVPLKEGINLIKIQSTLNNNDKTLFYKVVRKIGSFSNNSSKIINYSNCVVAEVIKNYAVIRNNSNDNRLTPIPAGIHLILKGEFNDSYLFSIGNDMIANIKKDDVAILTDSPKSIQIVSAPEISITPDDISIKFQLSQKSPFYIKQTSPNDLEVIIAAENSFNKTQFDVDDSFLEPIKFEQVSPGESKFSITTTALNFWGYSYYLENNNLVLKLKKPPIINRESPLKGLNFIIDAGHGGSESGSMGPTGVPEKNINLEISKNLKSLLEENGANVVMTRDTDKTLPLYDRVKNLKNTQILLSIHNNALPDGKYPYQEHGSSTYYYHFQSCPLAQSIQNALVKGLKFKNLGVSEKSLVLTRPNETLAVLIEVGFMIYPEEYEKLLQKNFQKKAAKSILKGIIEFTQETTLVR